MKLIINNVESVEFAALEAATKRALHFAGGNDNYDHIEIQVQPRQTNGRLAYLIVFVRKEEIHYVICMLQRTPEAEFEFHS